jgi:hypothetical protein
MGQFLLALLIVTGLALTTYFGAVAWHVSDDNQSDITGGLSSEPFTPLQRPNLHYQIRPVSRPFPQALGLFSNDG